MTTMLEAQPVFRPGQELIARLKAAYDRAIAVREDADARQREGWPAIGHGFSGDAAAVAVPSRYEASIEAALRLRW